MSWTPLRASIRRAGRGAALLVVLAAPAAAQDDATRAAARALAYEGNAAYERGDYASAEQKLGKAFSLVTVPVLGLASARARRRLGKLVEAAERYRQVVLLDAAAMRSAGAALNLALQQRAQREAASELEALLPSIPRLVIVVVGAPPGEVSVRVDGVALPSALIGENYPLNPGPHRLDARHGARRLERELSLREGELETLRLQFSPSVSPSSSRIERFAAGPEPQPAPGLQRVLGWSLLSLGAALTAVGVGSHIHADDLGDDISSHSIDGALACDTSDRARCDRYNQWRQIPPIAYAGGAVLAAAGGFLLIWPWAGRGLELSVVMTPEADGPSLFATLTGSADLAF